jgi:uncharacterized protein (DUF302 family)
MGDMSETSETTGEPDAFAEATATTTVDATVAALCDAAQGAGMTIFASVDHGDGARSAGVPLGDVVVVLLGAPAVGTAVMQADPRTGLDLPLRVLVWDDARTTRIRWRDPRALATSYALDGLGPVLEKMAAGLRKVIDAIT